jgi:hypothetical protein
VVENENTTFLSILKVREISEVKAEVIQDWDETKQSVQRGESRMGDPFTFMGRTPDSGDSSVLYT